MCQRIIFTRVVQKQMRLNILVICCPEVCPKLPSSEIHAYTGMAVANAGGLMFKNKVDIEHDRRDIQTGGGADTSVLPEMWMQKAHIPTTNDPVGASIVPMGLD